MNNQYKLTPPATFSLSGIYNKKKYPAWRMGVIMLLWAIVNSFFLWKNGIVTNGEAAKYIYQAELFIRTGHFESANFRLYSVQIFLLAFCLRFHLGYGLAVFIQLLLNLAATLYFFKTARSLFGVQKIAFLATTLLVLDLPYQAFNTFLQTESIFQSFSLLLSCYIISRPKISPLNIWVILLSLVILSLTRPTGLLYLPAIFLYFSLTSLKNIRPFQKIMIIGFFSTIFFYFLDQAMSSGGELDFLLPFREEHIICGSPTLLSPNTDQPSGNGGSLYALLSYIAHNPKQFIRLAAFKSWSFWGLYRSYYSLLHNALLIIYFYSINLAALYAACRRWQGFPYKLAYLLAIIFLTWGTVILTCDDWSNRFYLSISPYLILLSLPVFGKPSPPGPGQNDA